VLFLFRDLGVFVVPILVANEPALATAKGPALRSRTCPIDFPLALCCDFVHRILSILFSGCLMSLAPVLYLSDWHFVCGNCILS